MESTRQNTVATLEHLLVRSNNAREAYKNAAKNVHNRPMTSFFEDAALLHEQFSKSLKQEIEKLGGHPKDKTSLASDAERFWLDFASIIVRRNEPAILDNCAKAEEKAVEEYDRLLNQGDLAENVRNMLKDQRERAQTLLVELKELEGKYTSS